MPTALPGRLAFTTGATVFLVLFLGWSASAPAVIKKPPSAKTALSTLVKQTTGLPKSSITSSRRASLLRLARNASKGASKALCTSVKLLANYRKALKKTKLSGSVKKSQRARLLQRLAMLNASATAASRSLLASKSTKGCGGGGTPSTLSEAKATVLKSDESGITLRVQLPQLQFVPEDGGGKTFTKLVAPGTETPGSPGAPGIPVSSEVIAVPDGAT